MNDIFFTFFVEFFSFLAVHKYIYKALQGPSWEVSVLILVCTTVLRKDTYLLNYGACNALQSGERKEHWLFRIGKYSVECYLCSEVGFPGHQGRGKELTKVSFNMMIKQSLSA